MIETRLVNLWLGHMSATNKEIKLFRRQVINVQMMNGARITNAAKGMCDVYGICRAGSRHIEIEAKNVKGRLSDEQLRWKAWCESFGVLWIEIRAGKGETAEATVARWTSELALAVST